MHGHAKPFSPKPISAKSHGAQFIAVRDSRNRRISGLYTRNGRFCAQPWTERRDGKTCDIIFCSCAVMSAIDYLTIAQRLGPGGAVF